MRTVESTSDQRKKLVHALSRTALFSDVEAQWLEVLSNEAQFCIYEPSETIVQQGEAAQDFFIVLKGQAQVFVRPEGQETDLELAVLGPSSAIGEMGLLLDQPRSASVRAHQQILVARIGRALFGRLFQEVPSFGQTISRALARRLSATLRKVPLPAASEEALPDLETLKILPLPLIQRHRILPLRTEGNRLILGCVEEFASNLIERIKPLAPGMDIESRAISKEFFEEALRSLSAVSDDARQTPDEQAEVAKPLRSLMERAVAEGVSDIHLTAGLPPRWRLDGDIETLVDLPALGNAEVLEWLRPAMRGDVLDEFERTGDADFAVALGDLARFRVNLFRDNHGVGSVLRQIPATILTVEQLGLPKSVLNLASVPKGLVLVTGATGSGKSTTLAAMVDHINRNEKRHVITLEDPIEFVHPSRKALINQREVGVHTDSFHRALRAALRQDPDIVLVGELRDRETIELALEVANTGHLVFGTLHTTTAMGTVDRIVDIFPAEQQAQIRTTLAEVLRGVVSQALCKKRGGGRVAAIEVLVVNSAIANLIRKANTSQILSIMQTQRAAGNILLNEALQNLVRSGKVDYDEAQSKAVDKADLARRCGK